MVPIADVLNHIAKNNAHVRYEETELIIVSTRSIKKVYIFLYSLTVSHCIKRIYK
jgi:hypothetical protein